MTKTWGCGMALAAALMLASASVRASDLTVPMDLVTQAGTGISVGTVVVGQSPDGAQFKLHLVKLPPGLHSFQIHENGECGPTMMNGIAIPAGAAGRHWDPEHTYRHAGPTGTGHLGDLPAINVADDGTATQTLTAPRIKDIAALQGKALVIDTHGDTYSDKPRTNGGGGARLACGVIP